MPVFSSFHMSVAEDGVVELRARAEPASQLFLQPGEFVEVPEHRLAVRRGTFTVRVGALDKAEPIRVGQAGRRYWNCLPVTLQVFRVGDEDAGTTRTTRSEPVLVPDPYQLDVAADAGDVDLTAPYSRSRWVVRITNTTDRVAAVEWRIDYVRDTSLVSEGVVPLRVLNDAFSIALNALAPTAAMHGQSLRVQLSPEVAEFFHGLPPNGAIDVDVSDLPTGVGAHGELVSTEVCLVTGADALADSEQAWAAVDGRLRQELLTTREELRPVLDRAIQQNDERHGAWQRSIAPDDVTVRLKVVLTDVELVLSGLWSGDVPIGEVVDACARIYLVLKTDIGSLAPSGHRGRAFALSPIRYEGALLAIGDVLGLAPDLVPKLEAATTGLIPTVHGYFAEAVTRLAAGPHARRFMSAGIDGDRIVVRYCDDPADPGAFPVGDAWRDPTSPAEGGHGRGHGRGHEGIVVPPEEIGGIHVEEPPPPPPRGVVPSWFDLGSEDAVHRLDQIDTIVVVMMENRSFDHMLGRLSRKWPERGYRCYPDGAANTVPGRSPLTMVPARDVQVGATYLALEVDPYHSTNHVKAQINDGRMDGFAADIMTKPDPSERQPQLPLTYYDEADLPFFSELADQFMVCDEWFPAHPGGTYPNRWAFLSGTMPDTRNFSIDDPRMGFLRHPTIFDYLTGGDMEEPIEWLYYESNIGMLRMYDRYRLDARRVLQYDAPDGAGFEARARAGRLPPVVFIEPKITGIPPLAQASDDHPPGQPPPRPRTPRAHRDGPESLAAVGPSHARHHLRRTRRLLRPRPTTRDTPRGSAVARRTAQDPPRW